MLSFLVVPRTKVDCTRHLVLPRIRRLLHLATLGRSAQAPREPQAPWLGHSLPNDRPGPVLFVRLHRHSVSWSGTPSFGWTAQSEMPRRPSFVGSATAFGPPGSSVIVIGHVQRSSSSRLGPDLCGLLSSPSLFRCDPRPTTKQTILFTLRGTARSGSGLWRGWQLCIQQPHACRSARHMWAHIMGHEQPGRHG